MAKLNLVSLYHDRASTFSAVDSLVLGGKKYLWFRTLLILLIWPHVIFFLFSRLQSALKGQQFQDLEEIKTNTATELEAITLKQFQITFEKWQDRWNHCISSGDYFEG